MHKSYKFVLTTMLFLIFNSSFAEVKHGNGYSYIVTAKLQKLETDEEYITKFTKALGIKMEAISDRKMAPRLSKSDGKPFAYILRDPGKPRGDKPARRTTTLMAYNQEIPQAVKDLAIAEFGATPEDFKAFPLGFRFRIAERRSGKFTARFYLYRKDEKRDGTPVTIDMGEGTMLAMPKGVYKFTTKKKPHVKAVVYTLHGYGEVESMAAELSKGLKDAGFEIQAKSDAKFGRIGFKKGKVDGTMSLMLTSSKRSSVNLTIMLKSGKCQNKYGEISVPSTSPKIECI